MDVVLFFSAAVQYFQLFLVAKQRCARHATKQHAGRSEMDPDIYHILLLLLLLL